MFRSLVVYYISEHTLSDATLTADFFIPDIENFPETFPQTPERAKSISSLKKVYFRDVH